MNSAMSLNKDDLRVVKQTEATNNEIAFVHTFDPGLPQLFPLIQGYTSRLSTSRELKPIFGETRIINSQREPPSLGRILQHSKYEDSTVAIDGTGVNKCGRGCGCCEDILEVKSFYFRNSGITFEIKTPMNCTVRNLVYVIQCKKCGYTYIGETVNFRRRMSSHKSNSDKADAVMEVNRHLYRVFF